MKERLGRSVLDGVVGLDRSSVEDALVGIAAREAPFVTGRQLGALADDLVGMGPLEPLLRQRGVTDILVNGPDEVWVEENGALTRTNVRFDDADHVRTVIERVLAPLGLRLDRSNPTVDARLADGSRLHAVVPPATPDDPLVAIRRFSGGPRTLEELVEGNAITDSQAATLEGLISDRANLVVAGPTGTGKTTLLNVLASMVPPGERMVVIEDSSELAIRGHVVRLETRAPNGEGRGAVTMSMLVRSALRLRPDRIIVGEVRGPEAFDLVAAMATGHRGSMSTIHARGARDALLRLEVLATAGLGVESGLIRKQIEAAVDAVVVMDRAGGRRRVGGIRCR